jgi:hypothetical protein
MTYITKNDRRHGSARSYATVEAAAIDFSELRTATSIRLYWQHRLAETLEEFIARRADQEALGS